MRTDASATIIMAERPVELSTFTVSTNGFLIFLHWKTAIEENICGFEVERTINSKQLLMENWEKIGSVEANGTTNSPKSYSLSYNNLLIGKYLYRLKLIDCYGEYSYSHQLEITITKAPKEFISLPIYSNRFGAITTMAFTVPSNDRAKLQIFNIFGQKVATVFNGIAEAGTINQMQFNTSNLIEGVYLSRLEYKGQVEIRNIQLLH